MNAQQIATFLQTVPLFHELTSEQLHRLAGVAREVRFSAGKAVAETSSGEPVLFVLIEGECVEYIKQAELGIESQSRRLYAGDFLGIESIVVPRGSVGRTTAVASGRALEISKSVIDELMNESPSFVRTVCGVLAARVHRIEDMLNGIRFVRLDNFHEIESAMNLLPRRLSSVSRCLVVDQQGDRVTVAMANPADIRARSFIEDVLREYHVQFVAISEEDFEDRGRKLLGERIEAGATHTPFQKMLYQDGEGVLRPLGGNREDDLLSHLLTVAMRRDASDVHFEPVLDKARVRLRVDGRMVVLDEKILAATFRQLVTRIKVLSELDTTRIRRPQDGRFLIYADDHPVEFRVSASPCHGGESVVLRVVAPTKQHGDLSRLILHPSSERLARDLFRNPSGLVLVTGPSGAGKTTTLYAALTTVFGRDSSKSVVTIEDPVEYDLPFATQIQVSRESGMDFASVLRSVLRQDPDVILVGEIRDQESAAMAAEAATTGHLVVSSAHTYSALEAIVRMRDLKVPPYLLAAGLRGVVTQQLVPRLEPGFTEEVAPDEPIVRELVDLGVLQDDWNQPLLRGRHSLDGPAGGESGRVAIYEMLSVTPELSSAIDHRTAITEMRKSMNDKCLITFLDYARFLLKEGIVAPERILDVVPRGPAVIRYDDAGGSDVSGTKPHLVQRDDAITEPA